MIKVLILDENDLGQRVGKNFSDEVKIPYKFSHFKDGEMFIELEKSVKDIDVILVSTISYPVNDNLVKTLICCDTLRRSMAKSITLIVPYLGYSRQDRRTGPYQPITARLIADVLQAAGVNRVITCDLHARQIEGFYGIPIDNIPLMLILGNRWKHMVEANNINVSDFVVVSPDHGGVTRAREFMGQAGTDHLVIINKQRKKANEVDSMEVIGGVKNKNCIIIDDLVDTGGTLMRASKELKAAGAKKIYIYCTHGVLSADAIEKLSNCEEIETLVITNTIDKTKQLINDKIRSVDISDVISDIIKSFDTSENVYEYLGRVLGRTK